MFNVWIQHRKVGIQFTLLKAYVWQHHGNKKSDSLYYLNNGNNANTLS